MGSAPENPLEGSSMPPRSLRFLSVLLCTTLAAPLLLAGPASASDPLAGDAYAPPPNISMLLLYDFYHNDNKYGGQLGDPHGPDATQDTRIDANIFVFRYLHSFLIGNYNAGVQFYAPYVSYLGDQRVGINDLGTPAPGLLPSLGPGSAALGATSGFAQPNISLYFFPIANVKTGTYLVLEPWISPPISSFNKNNSLNFSSQNVWTFNTEFGFRTILFGTPDTNNLAIELWQETYFYANNPNSAFASPAISANNIPPLYTIGHAIDPAIPDTNPVRAASATPAVFREQPTNEFRVYLPYQFIARTHAFIAPGLYQSFGGKQTYRLNTGEIVDSGVRTSETQLRLVMGTFVTPSIQLTLVGDYDVVAHGTPYDRVLEFRFIKFFY
jgi:hypothetical protein